MGPFLNIFAIGFFISLSACFYLIFQSYRNNQVYEIRLKWIHTSDLRYDQYSYNDMYMPSFKNIFGLKSPKESNFPLL